MTQADNNLNTLAPDLGSGRGAAALLGLALLAALIIGLGRNPAIDRTLGQDLLLIVSYALAVALGGVLLLKLAAYPIRHMTFGRGMTLAFVLLLAGAAAMTELLHYGLYRAGIGDLWPPTHWMLLARILLITAVCAAIYLRYMAVRHQAKLDALSTRNAKLQALQSRIRPHFLFNSMNSIAGLLKHDPDRAERALQDLADVFRVLLADARKLVPITVETEITRQYLEIEKLRLGDRLQYKWSNSNVPRAAQIPSLTLQPLLENAIYHGIEPCFAGGMVNVEMWMADEMLNILINNPMPEVPASGHRKGNKIAMDNIRQRLVQHFGAKADLQSFEKTGTYYVKVRFPVVRA